MGIGSERLGARGWGLGKGVAVAVLVLAVTGCQPSVELEPSTSEPVAVEQPAPVVDERPERVAIDKPVREVKPTGTYGGAIAGAYRGSREKIEALGVQQAIQFWHAEHGRYPKSHEEFMEKCWKPLKSPFPEIEEGYEYRYDPEEHAVFKVLIEEEAEPADTE